MQIIDELEPTRRGIYAGAVMYLDFSGNIDSCIALRTMVAKGGRAYIQAGGGVVADSVPEREYQETVNKARALVTALEIAHRGERIGVVAVRERTGWRTKVRRYRRLVECANKS